MICMIFSLFHFYLMFEAFDCFNCAVTDLGIDRSIFIKPRTFHLTVLMLKLWNKDRVAAASEVLQVMTFSADKGFLVCG